LMSCWYAIDPGKHVHLHALVTLDRKYSPLQQDGSLFRINLRGNAHWNLATIVEEHQRMLRNRLQAGMKGQHTLLQAHVGSFALHSSTRPFLHDVDCRRQGRSSYERKHGFSGTRRMGSYPESKERISSSPSLHSTARAPCPTAWSDCSKLRT